MGHFKIKKPITANQKVLQQMSNDIRWKDSPIELNTDGMSTEEKEKLLHNSLIDEATKSNKQKSKPRAGFTAAQIENEPDENGVIHIRNHSCPTNADEEYSMDILRKQARELAARTPLQRSVWNKAPQREWPAPLDHIRRVVVVKAQLRAAVYKEKRIDTLSKKLELMDEMDHAIYDDIQHEKLNAELQLDMHLKMKRRIKEEIKFRWKECQQIRRSPVEHSISTTEQNHVFGWVCSSHFETMRDIKKKTDGSGHIDGKTVTSKHWADVLVAMHKAQEDEDSKRTEPQHRDDNDCPGYTENIDTDAHDPIEAEYMARLESATGMNWKEL